MLPLHMRIGHRRVGVNCLDLITSGKEFKVLDERKHDDLPLENSCEHAQSRLEVTQMEIKSCEEAYQA